MSKAGKKKGGGAAPANSKPTSTGQSAPGDARVKVQEFWESIQLSERLSQSIFNISKDDVVAEVRGNEDDLELLQLGLDCIEHEAGRFEWIVGKLPGAASLQQPQSQASGAQSGGASSSSIVPSLAVDGTIPFLSKLPDGVFISGNTCRALQRPRIDFVTFQNGVFNVIKNDRLDDLILSMNSYNDVPPALRYSEEKLTIRFVDMLTYPRPVRKFKMLFSGTTLLTFLREMMLSEVKLDCIDDLVLMTRGKAIPRASDPFSLESIGVKNNQQIIISRTLGKVSTSDTGSKMSDRNRQFVGDLLFGPHADGKSAHNSQSVVKTFRTSHGYQILGKCVERLILLRFSQAYAREEGARRSEEELYALLEEENRKENAEEEKKRKKKEKKKQEKAKKVEEEVPPPASSKGGKALDQQAKAQASQKSSDNDDDEDDDEDATKKVPPLAPAPVAVKNQAQAKAPVAAAAAAAVAVAVAVAVAQKNGKSGQAAKAKTPASTEASEEEELRKAVALSLKDVGLVSPVSLADDFGEEEIQVSSKKSKKANKKKEEPPPPPRPAPTPVATQQAAKVVPRAGASSTQQSQQSQQSQSQNQKASQPTQQPTQASPNKQPQQVAKETTRVAGPRGNVPSVVVVPPTASAAASRGPPAKAAAASAPPSQPAVIGNLNATNVETMQSVQSKMMTREKEDKRALPVPALENIMGLLGGDLPPGLMPSSTSKSSIAGLTSGLSGPSTMGQQIQNFAAMAPTTSALGGLGGTPGAASLGAAVAPAARFCSACGSRLQSLHRFCYNCGSSVEIFPVEPVSPLSALSPLSSAATLQTFAAPAPVPPSSNNSIDWGSKSVQQNTLLPPAIGLGVGLGGFQSSALNISGASTSSLESTTSSPLQALLGAGAWSRPQDTTPMNSMFGIGDAAPGVSMQSSGFSSLLGSDLTHTARPYIPSVQPTQSGPVTKNTANSVGLTNNTVGTNNANFSALGGMGLSSGRPPAQPLAPASVGSGILNGGLWGGKQDSKQDGSQPRW